MISTPLLSRHLSNHPGNVCLCLPLSLFPSIFLTFDATFPYYVSQVRWPIPVKQIQVNENKFKLTKTHPRKGNTSQKTETTPRKRKQLPENKNKFNLTKTTPRKRKQIQLNEFKFKLMKTDSRKGTQAVEEW